MTGVFSIPKSLGHVLDHALEHPEREALVAGEVRLTYGQLDDQIRRVQTVLTSLGVGDGDRVSVSLSNRAEIVIAFHAIVRLGALYVGINTILAPAEKRFMLDDSGARVLITDAAGAEQLQSDLGARLNAIINVDDDGESGWRHLVATAQPMAGILEVGLDHPAGIAYTSGTTGFPKGVVHTHRNVMIGPTVQISIRGYDSTMRRAENLSLNILNVVSLSPVLVGMVGGTLIAIASNNPRNIAEIVRREKATHYLAVPPIAYSLLHDDTIDGSAFETVTEITSGSAPLSEIVRTGFHEKFGVWIAMTYGQTESPACLAMENADGSGHLYGSSGIPLPHVELFAIDADGNELPRGIEGELCVRAARSGLWANQYTTMIEYWGNPEATRVALSGGYFRTGDVGQVDADGRLFVADRKSSMILRGGANVYPAEVERVINADPTVASSAVVGIADDRLGQRVIALVEPAAGANVDVDQIRAQCQAELARYKVPEEIYVIDEFPRNGMNKIVRSQLDEIITRLTAGADTKVHK
jgi:long-chain acyl-CoA synthetase